jgi:hypothetical protein
VTSVPAPSGACALRSTKNKMTYRILIVIIALSASLTADSEPKWKAVDKKQMDQESKGFSVFKEWRELSRVALEADKKEPRKLGVEREFNKKANESSTTIDCGVVCDLPKIGIKIEAKIHYFYKGDKVPDDIGENITITYNIKGTGSEGRGYFIISSLEPDFITKKENVFRSKTDGIGSLNDDSWRYSLLAIMKESDSRRLITEEVDNVHLGPVIITRPDLINSGLKQLLLDLDERREVATNK